jgi:hypothetical protein
MKHKKILLTLAIIVALGLVAINYWALMEAYGSGPPYYGRTTNMDKWKNPLPMLIAIDAIGVVLIFFLTVWKRIYTDHHK